VEWVGLRAPEIWEKKRTLLSQLTEFFSQRNARHCTNTPAATGGLLRALELLSRPAALLPLKAAVVLCRQGFTKEVGKGPEWLPKLISLTHPVLSGTGCSNSTVSHNCKAIWRIVTHFEYVPM